MQCPNCKAEVVNGVEVCIQCGTALKCDELDGKHYWLAAAPFVGFVVFLGTLFTLGLGVPEYFAYIPMTSLVVGLFLGIVSLIKINYSNVYLNSIGRAKTGIILCSIILVLFASTPLLRHSSKLARRLVCTTNVKGLGMALRVYSEANNGILPEVGRWCDQLILNADVDPKSFTCHSSGYKQGESSYVLNEHAAGKKFSELPKDMVLLFETDCTSENKVRDVSVQSRASAVHIHLYERDKDRPDYGKVYGDQWNQTGGPELLGIDHHDGRGCNVLFVDGHAEFCMKSRLPELRWGIEDATEFPHQIFEPKPKEPAVYNMPALAVIGGIVGIFTAWIVYRYKIAKHWKFVVTLAIFSALAGSALGVMAESLYHPLKAQHVGPVSGGIIGLLVGICYSVLMVNTPCRIKSQKTFGGFTTACGMVTGIICSTLVHLVLMIANENFIPYGILGGMPFGIAAGAFLGFWSGATIEKTAYERSTTTIEYRE